MPIPLLIGAAAIGAGAGLLGSLAQTGASSRAAREANDMTQAQFDRNMAFSREQFEEQKRQYEANMAYQKYVTENSHQISVEDMKKAGLNPVLAAGAGAQSPSPVSSSQISAPGMSQFQQADYSGLGKIGEHGARFADSVAQQAQIQNMERQTALADLQNESIIGMNMANADAARANAQKAEAEAETLRRSMSSPEQYNRHYEAEIESLLTQSGLNVSNSKLNATQETKNLTDAALAKGEIGKIEKEKLLMDERLIREILERRLVDEQIKGQVTKNEEEEIIKLTMREDFKHMMQSDYAPSDTSDSKKLDAWMRRAFPSWDAAKRNKMVNILTGVNGFFSAAGKIISGGTSTARDINSIERSMQSDRR